MIDKPSKDFAQSVIDQYHQDLHRFLVRRLSRSHLDAGDIAQETYLRLLRVDNVALIRKPQAYLYKIALNVVRELELKEQVSPVSFDSELSDRKMATASSINEIERLESASTLEAMLSDLPANYKAALILLKRDGLSYREIAESLGISMNTVKKYLFRAVKHCRHYKQHQIHE